jgi:cytochrome c553
VRALSSALSLFALAACHPIANDTEAALTASGELVALSGGGAGARNACFSCHGLDGLGDGDSVPRLAGMEVGYLQKQMEDYARALRHDPVMSPIARRLSEGDRRAVVAWYAAMPAPAGAAGIGTPAPILFAQGDPARGVVACAACHGDEGQGAGPGNPALAGQPTAYTLEQLMRWKRAGRRNDPRGVMTAAVAPLTDEEMRRIAVWLQTRSSSRPPDSGGASASVSATAAAEPAASRGIHHPDR